MLVKRSDGTMAGWTFEFFTKAQADQFQRLTYGPLLFSAAAMKDLTAAQADELRSIEADYRNLDVRLRRLSMALEPDQWQIDEEAGYPIHS